MEFLSHLKLNEEGQAVYEKLLKDHLNGVYQIASHSLYPGTRFEVPAIKDGEKVVYNLAYFHDLGKFSTYFQKYLRGEKVRDELKNHAITGAYYLLNSEAEPLMAGLYYYWIYNHHRNLDDLLRTGLFDVNQQTNKWIEEKLEDVASKEKEIRNIIPSFDAGFLKFPSDDRQKQVRKTFKKIIKKNPTAELYFIINYFFSLLIEADKLDASGTPFYERKPLPVDAVNRYIGSISEHLPPLDEILGTEQNLLRNKVRQMVLDRLNDPEITSQKIFSLSAPTGIGKTLTALDFALRLRKKIKEKEGREPQIIYALPFVNIIEQALDVYKKVLEPSGTRILPHYQFTDILSGAEDADEYYARLMLLNTWQADVVITSFVQLFETLVSNKNKKLLKFNHLAGSIIILDEIQSLAAEKLPFIGAMLHYLTKYLNATIIMMTATKPEIWRLAEEEILNKEGEQIHHVELLPGYEKVFRKFERTRIVPLLENSLATEKEFYEIFRQKRKKDQSALIVVNTVQRSIDLYHYLHEAGIEPLHYLSTNIVPAERLRRIEQIKEDLKQGKHPVLISTQVVEAGVDLDFDMGFRDIGPLDSIIQVAGRINRENHPDKKFSSLYVVKFLHELGTSEAGLVYDSLTISTVENILRSQESFNEPEYVDLIQHYFSMVAEQGSFEKSRKFFESVKHLKYDEDDYAVSRFRIIEEQPWLTSVFVELDDTASESLSAFRALLEGEMSKADFDRKYKNTFYRYIVNVPSQYAMDLENIHPEAEIIQLVRKEVLNEFYDHDTGFRRRRDVASVGIL